MSESQYCRSCGWAIKSESGPDVWLCLRYAHTFHTIAGVGLCASYREDNCETKDNAEVGRLMEQLPEAWSLIHLGQLGDECASWIVTNEFDTIVGCAIEIRDALREAMGESKKREGRE